MARKMKKFAQGGDAAQTARYARKTADIESDYQKALKAGKSSGIARAKYEQRMADARDDLAKWTRSDRTETRAAERAAERALSEARRTKGVSALRSKTPDVVKSYMDEGPIGVRPGAEVGAPKVSSEGSFGAAFRAALNAGDKTFPWRGKSYTTQVAAPAPVSRRETPAPARAAENKNEEIVVTGRRSTPENKDTREITVTAPKTQKSTAGDPAWARYRMGQAMLAPLKFAARNNPLSWVGRAIFDGEPTAPARAAAPSSAAARSFTPAQQAKLEQLRQAAEAPGASTLAKDRYRMAKETGLVQGLRKGGTVKKKAKGGTAKAKPMMKKPVKKMAKGGSIDGCAVRGKTRAKRTK